MSSNPYRSQTERDVALKKVLMEAVPSFPEVIVDLVVEWSRVPAAFDINSSMHVVSDSGRCITRVYDDSKLKLLPGQSRYNFRTLSMATPEMSSGKFTWWVRMDVPMSHVNSKLGICRPDLELGRNPWSKSESPKCCYIFPGRAPGNGIGFHFSYSASIKGHFKHKIAENDVVGVSLEYKKSTATLGFLYNGVLEFEVEVPKDTYRLMVELDEKEKVTLVDGPN